VAVVVVFEPVAGNAQVAVRQCFSHGGQAMPVRKGAPALHTLVFNSLSEQIAVIDQAGTIVDVNTGWTNFGIENGISPDYIWRGRNYLEVLSVSHAGGDSLAGEAANGIVGVVKDQRASFHFEYPCHSPDEKRWFVMRITGLKDDSRRLFAISHHNITRRKLAEERAEHLAMHDPITGLANRRNFNMALHREFRRSRRDQSAISLIAVDIDHFKEYNDECGHLAGDHCLDQVGQVLQAFSRRPDDLAARLGGDEFALLLGSADSAGSQSIAEAILKSFNDLQLVFGGSKQVTISVGVASAIAREHQHEDFLFHEADKALYRAKQAGRNRVVHADSAGDTQG
jgi:diguanylate cyclase (GGDEF)-like protein